MMKLMTCRIFFAIACITSISIACSGGETNTTAAASGQAAGTGAGGSSVTKGAGGTGGTLPSSGKGGASTSSGGGQGGSGGAGVAVAECNTDQDCKIVNTCCDCAGVPNGTDLPCGITTCKQAMCSLYQPQPVAALCRAGHCVTTVDCDISKVTCKSLPPDCPLGETNSVNPMTSCWGSCVAEVECTEVATCDQCVTSACVTYVTQIGPKRNCVNVPSVCNGQEDCSCMGPAVCIDLFDTCSTSPSGLQCHCPPC
jgi:hypothetical protein